MKKRKARNVRKLRGMRKVDKVREVNEVSTILLLRLRDWQSSSSNSSKSTKPHLASHASSMQNNSKICHPSPLHCPLHQLLSPSSRTPCDPCCRCPQAGSTFCSLQLLTGSVGLCCRHPADCILLLTHKGIKTITTICPHQFLQIQTKESPPSCWL